MKENVNLGRFRDAFSIRKANFTYKGLTALYDYLIEMEEDTGEEIELDVISLCCDYTEYESIEDVLNDYDNIKDLEDLKDNTVVIEFEGGIIIQAF